MPNLVLDGTTKLEEDFLPPDLVRAYMWYGLSAIGGDPDAAISQEEVVKKMTPEQIEKAHILIKDYKSWIYPFR